MNIMNNELYYQNKLPNSSDGIILQNNPQFSIKLSKNLPKYIEENCGYYVDNLLSINGLKKEDIAVWNIHPGGIAN